ncbi:hypothetical protein VB712_17490 [Spirulina sp. CCNP1310]|uniref:hypothetical protein n=1 Tax=Spirulina sp. CCNP1310 TaxID=3110249 RepID=UPI002B1EF30E|nr:hypothetical protein [Spirulina sp. CCNP1310]MEA5421022.1 hypothetical protein [Spirulina sp. CCNP1310]
MKYPTFLLMLLAGVAIALIHPQLTTAQTTTEATAASYPASERESFVNSCASGRGAEVRSVCACTYQKITQRYNYEQYQEIYRQVDNGQDLPESIRLMIRDCRQENSSLLN